MSSIKKSIVFAAGASGGHIVPAIAVHQALAGETKDIFIGVGRPVERKFAEDYDLDYRTISFVPLRGKGLVGILRLIFTLPKALVQTYKLFRQVRPSLLVCFGGYPSIVPSMVAKILGIPIFLQEQNAKFGWANKMVSKLAEKVFVPTETLANCLGTKAQLVGNPVRKDFFSIPKSVPLKEEGIFNLLVIGGSQGARAINDLVVSLKPYFLEKGIRVVIQSGQAEFPRLSSSIADGFRVLPFISNMPLEMSQADLILSRAGAMSVAEICSLGKPAIYIPLSIAGAHQSENLVDLVAENACWVFDQSDSAEMLKQLFESILSDKGQLKNVGEKALQFSKQGELLNSQVIAKSISQKLCIT